MSASQSKYEEVRDKIIKGSHLAVRRLIKERQKTNGELVIMVKGKITRVPAKEL
ncbi:MAG TPA: hypothetical protein VHE59_00525 [Mucilaginibacter sp.]|nr:hypothetical protein [Mucilaginibacter sp.]